jgi:hypothetical protein
LNTLAQTRPFLFQKFAPLLHHDHAAGPDFQNQTNAPALFRHAQLGQRIQGLGHCQRIDPKLPSQLPHRRKIGTFLIGAIQNMGQHPVDDLPINGKIVGPDCCRPLFLMSHRTFSNRRIA